jgi:gas vesicle protein
MNQRIYYSKEAELQAQREKNAVIALFLSLGLGIGAVLALLFAPRSGEEIRKDLASTLEDSLDSGVETSKKALSRVEKDLKDLREWVEDRLDR